MGYFLGTIFALNLLLMLFNLLPVPPLDGSAALVLGLPDRLVPRYQSFLWSNPGLGLLGISAGLMGLVAARHRRLRFPM